MRATLLFLELPHVAKSHELSRTLLPRHITMITIGGVIGAGLFVGSSAAIAAAGPAALISYILSSANW